MTFPNAALIHSRFRRSRRRIVPAVTLAAAALAAAVLLLSTFSTSHAQAPDDSTNGSCADLGGLTVAVSHHTLANLGELSKQRTSSDGECSYRLTLQDASEGAGVLPSESCTVWLTPLTESRALALKRAESGDCSMIAITVEISLPPTLAVASPSGDATGASARTAYAQLDGYELFGIRMLSNIVEAHYVVAGDTGLVSAYTMFDLQTPGLWWVQASRQYPGPNEATALYISNQWASFLSPALAYTSNNAIVKVTGQGNVSCQFADTGFSGPNLLNLGHYYVERCGVR